MHWKVVLNLVPWKPLFFFVYLINVLYLFFCLDGDFFLHVTCLVILLFSLQTVLSLSIGITGIMQIYCFC